MVLHLLLELVAQLTQELSLWDFDLCIKAIIYLFELAVYQLNYFNFYKYISLKCNLALYLIES